MEWLIFTIYYLLLDNGHDPLTGYSAQRLISNLITLTGCGEE